jgi:DNA-binding transcriptional MerR regulator
MQNYLTTGEAAKVIGISKRTLQNWLKLNKIAAPSKAANGYYLWSCADVRKAQEYKLLLQKSTNYQIGGQVVESLMTS